jgi:hypothetical protein
VVENGDLAIAQNFALLYAAGCLAIEAGILRWRRQQLLHILQRQLVAVGSHMRSFRITPRTIRRILRRRVRSPAVVQRTRGTSFGPANHAGFWRWEGIDMVFCIHTTAFRRWFGDTAYCRAALRWLHQSKLLVLRNRHALPSTKSSEWAERTPRWPDGSVQRSFVFKAPKSVRRYLQLPQDRRDRILKAADDASAAVFRTTDTHFAPGYRQAEEAVTQDGPVTMTMASFLMASPKISFMLVAGHRRGATIELAGEISRRTIARLHCGFRNIEPIVQMRKNALSRRRRRYVLLIVGRPPVCPLHLLSLREI